MYHTFNSYRTVFTFTFLLAATAASSVLAQSPDEYRNTPPGPFHQPVAPLPVELGFSQHHASTAAEGFLRGKAAVIQAQGNFQLSKSQSDILRQQARWLDRENDLKQTEALFAQKQLWSDARTQSQKSRNARRADGRVVLAERKTTVYRQAYQLSANELDASTGTISWPTGLDRANFDDCRTELSDLFQQHFGYGEPQAATAERISHTIDQVSRSLKNDRDTLARDEYLAAQKFLAGLKYAATTAVTNTANSGTIVARPVAGGTLATQ